MTEDLYKTAKFRLETVGFHQIKRFNAVKGLEMGEYIKDRKNVTLKAHYDLVIADHRRAHHELGTMGAIGCYLSHVGIWKQLVGSNAPGYYVFESDAKCFWDPQEAVQKFLGTTDPHILFLGIIGTGSYPSSSELANGIQRLTSRFYGTHAYYITKEGAKRCLEYAFPIEE